MRVLERVTSTSCNPGGAPHGKRSVAKVQFGWFEIGKKEKDNINPKGSYEMERLELFYFVLFSCCFRVRTLLNNGNNVRRV
jgi:hypothetical protein